MGIIFRHSNFKKRRAFLSLSLLLLALCLSCTSLIYYPDPYLHGSPEGDGIAFTQYTVPSLDGTKLVAWELKSKTPHPENLVLMFHGNAENLSSHFYLLSWLTSEKSDLIVFDYRGYGLSSGSPNPHGVSEDGLKFLQLAHTQFKQGGYRRFIVYAQSLGGAVALKSIEEFAERKSISLLVLDSTFRSPREIASDKTFGLLGWTISDEADAPKAMPFITFPILSIHAEKDPVIPLRFGRELFDSLPSTQKTFWNLEGTAGNAHGNVFFVNNGEYRQKFVKFLQSIPSTNSGPSLPHKR
jgi:fermentation-respiration switch protein FrsA (DUF1100 family)